MNNSNTTKKILDIPLLNESIQSINENKSNIKLFKIDSQTKINYIEKLDILPEIISLPNMYYLNIEKILKKLAYFKSSVINLDKTDLTEWNIYIKTFIKELQIPLSTIHTGLNILINNIYEFNSPKLEKNIDLISGLEKTLKYIDDKFTKLIYIHDGQIKLNQFEPFSIEYLIIKVETNILNDLYEKNINFKYNIDQDITDWFMGDVYNIIYIIKKLIKNAIKYSIPNRNNNIMLNVSSLESNSKKNIIITITDNNDNIPLHIKKTLFDPLSGLYICKTILELHNGNIYHNNLDNIGNIFTINLNLETFVINNNNKINQFLNTKLKKSLRSINFEDSMIFNDNYQYNYNVLIINNNETERLYLYKIFKLNKNFNSIYTFNNGLDALCKLYNSLESIDLIIINIDQKIFKIDLLNINGIAIANLLRSMNYNKLIIGICDDIIFDWNLQETDSNLKYILDNSFDYVFYNPFDRNKINLLFDFIDNNGVNIKSNKRIKLIENKLEWFYI
jgi:two-component sensor histidine kinase